MATILVVTIWSACAVTTWFIAEKINERADIIELLLDGIIDRLNKLEKK